MEVIKLHEAREIGEGAHMKFEVDGQFYTGLISKDDMGNTHIKLSPASAPPPSNVKWDDDISNAKILPIENKEKSWTD